MQCQKTRKGVRCNHRFVLRKPPEEYVRPVKCPSCGSTTALVNREAARRKEVAKQKNCYCDKYPFIHKEGSLRMCVMHPLVILGVAANDEEFDQYEKCLLTKREFQK